MEEVLVPLIVFATFFGMFYVYFTTRNKERMALIEKGADASLFNSGKKYNWKNFSLSAGMFLIGIGLGIMVGALLAANTALDEGAAYTLSIFFFAGLALVIYFFLARNMEKKDNG
jgi:preprotein translocase subunit YajC